MHQSGHLGAALLGAAPFVLGINIVAGSPSGGLLFTLLALAAGRVPDTDQKLPGIKHRGVTHTFAFIIIVSILGGAAIAMVVDGFPSELAPSEISLWIAFVYGTTALFVGGVSHLLTDAITAGSGDYAIHPFWPVSCAPLRFDMTVLPAIAQNPKSESTVWNGAFVILGLLTQGAAYSLSQSVLLG